MMYDLVGSIMVSLDASPKQNTNNYKLLAQLLQLTNAQSRGGGGGKGVDRGGIVRGQPPVMCTIPWLC